MSDCQSIGSAHGSMHSIHSIHSRMNSLHRSSPASLIQEALDAARARDLATTAALLLQSTSPSQEVTSPGCQVHVSLPPPGNGGAHTAPSTHAGPAEPAAEPAKPVIPQAVPRCGSRSPESEQLVELKLLGHDHRRAHAGSPLLCASAGEGAAVWEPGAANTGCSVVAFSKFLHMQHKYLSMHGDDAEECAADGWGEASTSTVVVKSAAMEKLAREECGSEDWGTHLDDAKEKEDEATSSKRAREECGSENWGTHLDDKASRAKVARTEQVAGPSIK